jgi:two-component system chemotaxis sensor kinase CheA
LALLDVMVVRVANWLFALPIDVVLEILQPRAEQMTHSSVEDRDVVQLRGSIIPVLYLSRYFGVQQAQSPEDGEGAGVHRREAGSAEQGLAISGRHHAGKETQQTLRNGLSIVVETGGQALALPLEEILGHHQVMIKPLPASLKEMRGAAGCALMGTGDVAVLLDPAQLVAAHRHRVVA